VPPPVLQYLQQKSVQEELKMTEAQLKKLPDLEKKWQDATSDRPGTFEEFQRKRQEATAAIDQAISELLDKVQNPRFRQIELQQAQKRGLGTLLPNARAAKGLELTDAQQKKIADLNRDAPQPGRLISAELLLAGRQQPSEEYTKTIDGFNQVVEKKLTAVLTEAQQARLKGLLGEPFKGEINLPRGPGG